MKLTMTWLVPLFLMAAGCASVESTRPPEVRAWGSMREVLREGRTEGRVVLDRILGEHSIAVGALEGLGAEITVDGGVLHLAEASAGTQGPEARERDASAGERATLLLVADVSVWDELSVPADSDLAAVEEVLRKAARKRGWAIGEPFPFRVEGVAEHVELHVLNGSCPIANPSGPAPWRASLEGAEIVLVGFFAENAAGKITHHNQNSHTHVVVPENKISGHLDRVRLRAGARLFLPSSSQESKDSQ